METLLQNSPDTNSLGICFLPAVVTRYNWKSSMRKITHEDINFAKLSSTVFCCWLWWVWLCWLPPEDVPEPALLAIGVGVLLPVEEEALVGLLANCVTKADGFKVIGEFGVLRSSGACDEGRFGWLKLSTASRKAFSDSFSQRAGAAEASLYLQEY